jgi:DNA-binding protein WhiA
MSFSGSVKEELLRCIDSARHCQIAELAAVLAFDGEIVRPGQGQIDLRVSSENESLVRKYFTLLTKTFNIETAIVIREGSHLKRGKVYLVEVTDPARTEEVLQGTKLSVDNETGLLEMDNSLVVQMNCCKRAFIRGTFLSSGSISDPEKGYHFEIVCPDSRKAEQLQGIIRSFHVEAKIVVRKKSYVVYVKEGAQIVDMLAVMEANVALMDLENIRILKEMRNTVNRKVNCEAANINKTVNAAVRQVEDIQLISRTIGFESLSDGLAQVARLRLQYPDATLKELGMMLNPQVGKSGVNHRLRKLSEIADELRENKEELL